MSKGLITKQYLTDIADAIREKTGEDKLYLPSEMAEAVRSIVSKPDVTITYNVEGVEYAEQFKEGEDILHPITVPTYKENYTFYGWSLSVNGDRYKNGSASKDLYLYALFVPTTVTFVYTGSEEMFNAKEGIIYYVEAYGAKGGNANTNYGSTISTGSNGAKVNGYYHSVSNRTLYVNVGGQGGDSTQDKNGSPGYNGGGDGGHVSGYVYGCSGAGGGGTSLCDVSGLMPNILPGNPSSPIVVAGGGAGGRFKYQNPDWTAQNGNSVSNSNGVYGKGNNASGYSSNSGGGGYYGGSSGYSGTNYIENLSSPEEIQGANNTNGQLIITVSSIEE